MTQRVVIIVRSEQKGLFASIGLLLSEDLEVLFVADSRDAANVIKKIFHNQKPNILIEPDYRKLTQPEANSIKKAQEREEIYDIRYSLIISMDRALGRGYLINVDNYPIVKRANWTRQQKFDVINRRFEFFEKVLVGNTVLISQWPEVVPTAICNTLGKKHFHLVEARYGSRMMWSDGDRLRGTKIRRILEENIEKTRLANTCSEIPINPSNYTASGLGKVGLALGAKLVTRHATLKEIFKYIFRRLQLTLIGRGKSNSYPFLAWLPIILKRRRHFLYLSKIGLRPVDLANVRVAYFPLQMEPEISLQQMGYELNNANEVITWISKSISASTILVVKEQPKILGHRSKMFYRNIAMLGNVVFSDPGVDSWDWIRQSYFVVSIVGGVGQEAVHLGKPVVSFGRDQIINQLPTVFLARTYENVKEAIDKIDSGVINELNLEKAKRALGDAIYKSSFELEEYKDSFHGVDFDETSYLVLNELEKAFPNAIENRSLHSRTQLEK